MDFECYSEWTQLPDSANALFAVAERHSVFFSRAWFENISETALDDGQSLLLACVLEDEAVLGILPLIQTSGESWSSLTHRYSSLYSMLLDSSNQPQVLECLARGLAQLPFRFLRLEPFAEDDRTMLGLQQALQGNGFQCHRGFRFFNWFHRSQGGSFHAYMAGRPGRVRNTIQRKWRKLEREQEYELRLFTGDQVPDVMSDYHRAYQASWKANELFGDIVDGLTWRLSQQGWTRLAVLYINGAPAAAQLWFVVHRKASIFRLAYDQQWQQYSPGSILTRYLMQYVIDSDQVEEIDFLMGNERYKQDWMSERRERWSLTCAKPAEPKGWIQRALCKLGSRSTRHSP